MSSRFPLYRMWLLAMVICGMVAPASSKTIMWLGNFFQQGAFTNGTVFAVDSIWVQRVDSSGNQGYYYAARNQQLAKSAAYVDQTVALSSMITWWSIPTWSPNLYRNGNFKMYLSYRQVYGTTPGQTPQVVRSETQEMDGRYSAMPNNIDSCLSSVPGDTVWMYYGLGQWGNPQNRPSCSDHNPYLQKFGTVHLLNPWPGRLAYVQWNGKWIPLYGEPGRPGWVAASFYGMPGSTPVQRLVFASADPGSLAAGIQYMDMTGIGLANNASPFDFSSLTAPWERWIAPPVDGSNASKVLTTKPALSTTLMIRRPTWNASALRVTWKGVPGRFIAQSTPYCEWFSITFYSGLVPSSIVLTHPFQDTVFGSNGLEKAPPDLATYANWITVPTSSGSDTLWLNTLGTQKSPSATKPPTADIVVCNEKVLAFKVFDYKIQGSYFPFSEKTNSDMIKGLVGATLGADGLPTYTGKSMCGNGDAKSAECTNAANGPNNWFKKNANNTTGCLLQPLKLNGTTGRYEYSSGDYFPLDTLIKDPAFNEKLPPTASQSHDFGFCMHAKSTFEYVPGLSFSFRGDDDVWVFIDKKLALDIGGQHGPIAGDINLDKMSLLEGRAYQFDMFYCERHTPGSNILIQTTMNLVPSYDFKFDSTSVTGSGMRIDLNYIKSEIDGSKCQDDAKQTPVKGKGFFFLQFPDGHSVPIPEPPLASGLDGVTILPDLGSIELDLDKLKKDSDLNQRGLYKIVIRFQNDPSQANIKEIPFEVSQGPVDLIGDLFDRDGDGKADSLVVHAGKDSVFKAPAFKNLRAVWAKANGMRDSVTVLASAVRVSQGDSVATVAWSASNTPFQKRTGCPASGCIAMGLATTYPYAPDSVRNLIKVFREHLPPFADSASVAFGSGVTPDTLRIWIGEGAMQSPDFPTSPWALVGNRLAPRNLLVVDANNPAPIQAGGRSMIILLPAGHGLQGGDSLRLAARMADSLGNSSGTSNVWVPIRFGTQPIRVIARDRNGDGRVDSIEIKLTKSAAGVPAPAGFGMIWNGTQMLASNLARSVDQLSWSGAIGPYPVGTTSQAADAGWIAVGADVNSFRANVEDSVAPVVRYAKLVYGFDPGSADTLILTGSEGLSILPAGQAFVSRDSGGIPTVISSPLAQSNGTLLTIAVPAGSIPADALWARFGTGVSDGHTSVGNSSLWVRLVVTPSGKAALFDADGDGRADSVHVRMRGSLVAPRMVVSWCDGSGNVATQTWLVGARTGDFGMRPASGQLWFEKGVTSCSKKTTVTFQDANGSPLATWPLLDSVAPMLTAARYGFGALADTLEVRFSEPVAAASSLPSWVEWKGTQPLSVAHDVTSSLSPDGQSALLILKGAALATSAIDSARIASGSLAGRLVDAGGVKAGAASPFVQVSWGVPPMVAALSDPTGAGRATTLSAKVSRPVPIRALQAVQKLSIRWDGQSQDVLLAALAPDGAGGWKGALAQPFALGSTQCGSDCQATAVSLSGLASGAILLDSVPPSLVNAAYRYSKREVARDTFLLTVSEPWRNLLPANVWLPLVTAGRPAAPIEVDSFQFWLPLDDRTFMVIVDTSWQERLHRGDSARLSWNSGTPLAVDAATNAVGALSRWVKIDFGQRPLELVIRQENALLRNGFHNKPAWVEPPLTVPGLELLVKTENGYVKVDSDLKRDPATGAILGGNPPLNDPDKTMGVYIKLNRPMEGTLFVYDNMGTAVHQEDLSRLKELWPDNGEDVQQEIKVTWNGTNKKGRFVAGGVYLLRAVVKFQDKSGKKEFHNLLWKYAWMRPNK